MTQIVVAVLGLCGLTVTAFGAWVIAKHRESGKVGTSDAAGLWQEGKDLREFLVSRIDAQAADIAGLQREVRDLKLEVAGLRSELKER